MKLLGVVVVTFLCAILALWPEFAMYIAWHLINPESELTRILLVCAFWFGGASLCVGFGALGLYMWIHGINEVLK
jgi:hypothetical protein